MKVESSANLVPEQLWHKFISVEIKLREEPVLD